VADYATSTPTDTTQTTNQPAADLAKLKATIEQQNSEIARLQDEVKHLTSELEEKEEFLSSWISGENF